MSQKAAFQLEKYLFNKVSINIDNKLNEKMSVDFAPSGTFFKEQSQYDLKFTFKAFYDEYTIERPYVLIECSGLFSF